MPPGSRAGKGNRLALEKEVMRGFLQVVRWLMVSELLLGAASAGTLEGRVQVRRTTADLGSFVISVDDVEGRFPAPAGPVMMDQKSLRFVPHVLPILVGTTVQFPNSDPLAHNVFSISEAKRFNLGLYGPGTVRQVRFDRPGVVQLLCNVHLEMSGFIVVLRNPYFARTAADGAYRINGIPAGRHRVRCWHEKFPEQTKVVDVPANGATTLDFDMEAQQE